MRRRFEVTGTVTKEDPFEPVRQDMDWIFNQAMPFVRQGWLVAEELTVWDEGGGKYRVSLVLDNEKGLKPILPPL
jgi:hypothetical protein